jgi:hypothetical protein
LPLSVGLEKVKKRWPAFFFFFLSIFSLFRTVGRGVVGKIGALRWDGEAP